MNLNKVIFKLMDIQLKDYSKEEMREKIGLVLQDPFLFYGRYRDNIRLHNQHMTDEEVKEAARICAGKYILLKNCQDAYNQKVTERGSTFSSGQRQLVAFATNDSN